MRLCPFRPSIAALAGALLLCPSLAAADSIDLPAEAARIHGTQARFMVLQGIGSICYWTDAADWVDWTVDLPHPGRYFVVLRYSCQAGSEGSTFEVTIADQRLEARIGQDTGTWYDHRSMTLGEIALSESGRLDLTVRPTAKPGQAVMNLAWLRLVPADEYPAYERALEVEVAAEKAHESCPVYLVPNFHPASCGWLTDFSTERNYCAYSYYAHLDRVRDDPNYKFALSEVNTMMAMMAFEPERVQELRRRIHEGRVGLVNAFFLEPTINLSGGEALVKMGVEGLRWQEEVLGVRPRTLWAIDVTGVHEQMGQIVSRLGLDAMVYTRDNPTPKSLHWLESPDGSRALCVSPGAYADWGSAFNTRDALNEEAMKALVADAAAKTRYTPVGAPVLVLGGAGDYSLPPARPEYPAEFLTQWARVAPERRLSFATLSDYLDAALPGIRSGAIELPTTRSGAKLSWTSFWIQNPTVKGRYRASEHALQASEALATIASAEAGYTYPVERLYDAWLQMLLNMDRNTLWGAAGGMVFEHPRSWDVRDRFDWVDRATGETDQEALRAYLGEGECIGLYNPVNWKRTAPFTVALPPGSRLAGVKCEQDSDGRTLCVADLPSMGTEGHEVAPEAAPVPKPIDPSAEIDTTYYRARIDPRTGALCSLRLKPSGREMLARPVLVVAETGGDGHNTPPRPERRRLADSGQGSPGISVTEGPVATVVRVDGTFIDGTPLRQTIDFFRDHPRIDFDVETSDIPNATVVLAEVPLAGDIAQVRRGVPYGFSHGAWAVKNPALTGYADGIQAAIRWSHYQLTGGGGVAILDRGLPGRELNDSTPTVFFLNAQDTYMGYPCAWLSGRGKHHASFALVAHRGDFRDAGIARMAYEYNAPPIVVPGVAKAEPRSFIETSDNVVVEALRREGPDIELRMVECLGEEGTARVALRLPHAQPALTDLVGGRPQALTGGPMYEFPIRPQQIVTIRLRAPTPVPEIKPLLSWDELVPPCKLAALRRRLPGRVGHPPLGPGLSAEATPDLPADTADSYTLDKPATASNVYRNMAAHAAAMAVDGDPNTRWATDDGVSQATLEVDLGRPERIGRVYLSEAYGRVRQFELQHKRDGEWVTFARGGRIGTNLEMEFEPVTAQLVRLNVTDGPGGPTIWEFLLFPPK